MALRSGPPATQSLLDGGLRTKARRAQGVVSLQILDGDPAAQIVGSRPTTTTRNYLVGKGRIRWLRDIPTFQTITYEKIYPGIDLVFYEAREGFEYDFVVAPGADPSRIKLKFKGAKDLRLRPDGDLAVRTPVGQLVQREPVIFQQDTNGARIPIAGGYRIGPGGLVDFRLARWDQDRTLVIDPVLSFSSFLGGGGDDYAREVTVDESGKFLYVIGTTWSVDFPPQPPTSSGGVAFLSKIRIDGNESPSLMYSTYFEGPLLGQTSPADVASDREGNIYLTGSTSSAGMPDNRGGAPGGQTDAFLLKLDPSGSNVVYWTYLGGADHDGASGLAVDSTQSAFIAGVTNSLNFPRKSPLPGVPSTPGLFVSRIDTRTSGDASLRYSTYLGVGSTAQSSADIAVDHEGNALVVGRTTASGLPTVNGFQSEKPDGSTNNAFISKVDPPGSSILYSSYLGGPGGSTEPEGIAADSTGQIFITGRTTSGQFPTLNAFQKDFAGDSGNRQMGFPESDAFITRLDSTLSGSASLIYSSFLGGSAGENIVPGGIAAADASHVYITGSTTSIDFPSKNSIQPSKVVPVFGPDGFVALFNTSAAGEPSLAYSTNIGGTSSEFPEGLAVDGNKNVYVTGRTNSSRDFPQKNQFQETYGGGSSEGFIMKIGLRSLPFITEIKNATGSVCGQISATIVGSGFREVTAVHFAESTVSREHLRVNGEGTEIVLVVPEATSPGPVPVSVSVPWGRSDPATFVYLPPAPPSVTALSQRSGPTAGGTPVSISGTGLACATSVTFGGPDYPARFRIVTDNQIVATSPPHPAATVNVAVITARFGSSVPTPADQFVYLESPLDAPLPGSNPDPVVPDPDAPPSSEVPPPTALKASDALTAAPPGGTGGSTGSGAAAVISPSVQAGPAAGSAPGMADLLQVQPTNLSSTYTQSAQPQPSGFALEEGSWREAPQPSPRYLMKSSETHLGFASCMMALSLMSAVFVTSVAKSGSYRTLDHHPRPAPKIA